ncbi:hypothetical protein Aph02nite_92970 [Actinoplanes philippinensis]|uniref:DUF3558 domain-containing protein n=1 Tax=Actinoplanes philippinensis TaxID=35752 RepID=A0A1I2N217_9ACTN|nr:hypothetical protein [Actinoplanes philippinensis]GIE83347.1 hypothetical protein Aph02nite_92970 [Actinoplanes philippinensis]SFF97438.1 hypothetical protein SAMN05421541_13719 [Actinoplanes philippinensis]
MAGRVRLAGVVTALSLLAACDTGAAPPTAGTQPTVTAAPVASAVSAHPAGLSDPAGAAGPMVPTTSAGTSPPASCARESRPGGLLTSGDAWPAAEFDAVSLAAYQLDGTCDGGPEWPRDCDLFDRLLLDGWPGYRAEGVRHIAGISVLSTSGTAIEERILLFRTPDAVGRQVLADRARACGATRRSLSRQAALHEFPAQAGRRRFLVIDRTFAIQLTVPAGVDATRLIDLARRRAGAPL